MRFNLHSFLLGENCVLLFLQILLMTFSDRLSSFLWIPLQVIFVGLFLLLDGRILYKILKKFLFPKSNEKKG